MLSERELADRLATEQLEYAFQLALFGLRAASAVRAAPIESVGTMGSKPGSRPPRGYSGGTEDRLLKRWNGCHTDFDRLQVLKDAQRELAMLRYSPDRSERPGTREWKRKIAQDDRTSAVVARVYRVSPRTVRKLRRELRSGKLNR